MIILFEKKNNQENNFFADVESGSTPTPLTGRPVDPILMTAKKGAATLR
jgi:hypothetical protein